MIVNTVIYKLVDVILASFRLDASPGLVLEKTTCGKINLVFRLTIFVPLNLNID
jgi:hypothetical protein